MDKVEKKSLIKSLLSSRLTPNQRKYFADLEPIDIEIRKQWNESGNRYVNMEIKEQIWKKIKTRCESKKRNQVLVGLGRCCIAAVFMLLVGIWVFLEKDESPDFVEIVADHSRLYILPDSTKVWMEEGSRIRYAKAFDRNRKVRLDGNSLFEVRKQEDTNFQVYIDNAFIEVKGTCFGIKQYADAQNEITLYSGNIDFHVEATGEKIALKPLQKIHYDAGKAEVQTGCVENISWENGRYYFKDVPLSKLIDTINQMYHTHILWKKEQNVESAFTGNIRYDEPLKDIVAKICFSMDLSYEEHGDSILIY